MTRTDALKTIYFLRVGAILLVGVAGVAEARPVLGFDMGGTSTDVCRYAGALERRDTARVAGVRVRAPSVTPQKPKPFRDSTSGAGAIGA